jgi:hypothetical protein
MARASTILIANIIVPTLGPEVLAHNSAGSRKGTGPSEAHLLTPSLPLPISVAEQYWLLLLPGLLEGGSRGRGRSAREKSLVVSEPQRLSWG